MEIGNWVCNFGAAASLLDKFEERVLPAFSKLRRAEWNRGETYEYLFLDYKFQKIDGDVYLIAKIIKRLKIRDHQRLHEASERLKSSNKIMPSDPSSTIILRLFDHKIILYKETPVRAPGLKDVENAVRKLMRHIHNEIHKKDLAAFKKKHSLKNLTKALRDNFENIFEANHPEEDFRITPIGASDKAQEILARAIQINSFRFSILVSNDERVSPRTSILQQLVEERNAIGNPKTTTSQYAVADRNGINSAAAKEMVEDAIAMGGNANFKTSCIGKNGDKFTVSQNEVSVKPCIQVEQFDSESKRIKAALEEFKRLEKEGIIHLALTDESNARKAQAELIFKRMNK
jgi:hypothetical protein